MTFLLQTMWPHLSSNDQKELSLQLQVREIISLKYWIYLNIDFLVLLNRNHCEINAFIFLYSRA